MKSLIIVAMIALALVLAPAMVMAENTGNANYTSPIQILEDILNDQDLVLHSHAYEEYEPAFEAGIGVDLIVYQNADQGYIPDEVTVESKYDISNSNGSVYIVAKYNIWERFFKPE